MLLVLSAYLLIPSTPAAEFKILDPNFHVVSCHASVGYSHVEGNVMLTYVLDSLRGLHFPVRYRLISRTGTKSLGLVVRYAWEGSAIRPDIADMADESGHVYPLRLAMNGGIRVSGHQNYDRLNIWLLDNPPQHEGDYEFRIRLATNQPPIATWKVHLKGN